MQDTTKEPQVQNGENQPEKVETPKVEKTPEIDPEVLAEREAKIKQIQSARNQETDLMNPTEWGQMGIMANTFDASKSLPAHWDSPSKIMVGLQVGKEMGMQPMESLNSLYIVNGSVNVWGKAIVRRLREHGYSIFYEEKPNECTATVKRGSEIYTEKMTFEDAEKSGYTKDKYGTKVGWRDGQNRKLKLRYGSLASLIKSYIPEVLGSATDVVLGDTPSDYDFADKQAVSGEIVEGTKPKLDTDQFKKFVNAGGMFIRKHKDDYDFTEEQQKQVDLIVGNYEKSIAIDDQGQEEVVA